MNTTTQIIVMATPISDDLNCYYDWTTTWSWDFSITSIERSHTKIKSNTKVKPTLDAATILTPTEVEGRKVSVQKSLTHLTYSSNTGLDLQPLLYSSTFLAHFQYNNPFRLAVSRLIAALGSSNFRQTYFFSTIYQLSLETITVHKF